jgi:hypothetical protein
MAPAARSPPKPGELVVSRTDLRSEPFGIGRVVGAARPAAAAAAAAPAAAAATSASDSTAAPAQDPLADDTPLSALVRQAREEKVAVQWYDLEESWVTQLRLNDDAHWAAQYAAHAAADAAEAAQLGSEPVSSAWIVDQYEKARFFPKPNDAPCELPVDSLIAFGSPDLILQANGRLQPLIFSEIRKDLTGERPQRDGHDKPRARRGNAARLLAHADAQVDGVTGTAARVEDSARKRKRAVAEPSSPTGSATASERSRSSQHSSSSSAHLESDDPPARRQRKSAVAAAARLAHGHQSRSPHRASAAAAAGAAHLIRPQCSDCASVRKKLAVMARQLFQLGDEVNRMQLLLGESQD